MLAKALSYGLWGIQPYPVEIEVDVSRGLPAINLVGLANTAIQESRVRVKAAIKNSGFDWPQERVTISLAPSDIKKEGAGFDLAIALAILAASGQISAVDLDQRCILAELSLDGSLRSTKGILPICLALAKSPVKEIVVSPANAREAAVVPEMIVRPIQTLRQAVEFLNRIAEVAAFNPDPEGYRAKFSCPSIDFSEIKGQYAAKRALEIAVAGGHNILMIGPPGSGKTMLAKRIPTIMPDLTLDESLQITILHSVAGTLPPADGIMTVRPFRMPHQTVSDAALVGGGSIPQPGEISLAHQGVLFLDELPEFRRNCLEALRQPLEDGLIHVNRVNKSLTFPASFMLVCAMNPCPCGYYTDPQKVCRCNPAKIASYIGRISGPLLDRIDIHIELPPIKYHELTDMREAEASEAIRIRVQRSRQRQHERLRSEGVFCNAQMSTKMIRKLVRLEAPAQSVLKTAMTELGLSARAYDKVLRVSRTIADLEGCDAINPEHVAEAVQYRSLDRRQ